MERFEYPHLQGARILVVEDEFFLASDLADSLRDVGAEVIGPAPTVEAAERLIGTGRPDCAVLDMNLRGASSSELAHRLDRIGVGYVILTGYDAAALPEELKAKTYFEKPANIAAVLASLSDLLAEGPAAKTM